MATLSDAETLGAAELRPHQHAYVAETSAFYRELWAGLRVPEDLAELPALPLSDKAQLRASQAAHPPFGSYLAAAPSAAVRLHRTSGTTGQAMNLALSARDCETTESVGGRSHRAAGLTPGHTVVHCLNYQMWMGGVTDHLTLERTGATVVPFGVGNTADLIRAVREIGIDAISCTPSYPAVLERVLAEQFPGLRLGLFGGEAVLDDLALRQKLRDTRGMEPRNANYGVSDVLSNFAAQCADDTRLHFLAGDVLYPELVDPESGDPLPLDAGRQGELVLTHLERECQPLVCFRTGDIVAVDATEPCRCGRAGMRFRVVGRSDDMVIPTMIAAVIGGFAELSGDYRMVLDGPPPYDMLPVRVERAGAAEGGAELGSSGAAADAALAERIEGAVKAALGVTARVAVLPPGSFPVTEGKTKRVVRSDR